MIIEHKFFPDLDRLAAKLTGDVRSAKRAGMINIVTSVEARAKKEAPVKTSNLANSGTSDVNADASIGTVTFGAPYARYVHEGTGLYGPHKTKIVPKSKKFLFWPGAAHPIRAVKGIKGNPFLLNAAENSNMETLFTTGADNFLKRT